MARLHFKEDREASRPIELNWGSTVIGRGPQADATIDHDTISHRHCVVMLEVEGVLVRDCGSTNGTYINGTAIREGWLADGQTLRLGDVELVLEYDTARVSVPEIPAPAPPRSYHLEDGISCLNHPQAVAAFHCTQCHHLLCRECVRELHREGGRHHVFCSRCGGVCQPITFGKHEQTKSFLRRIKEILSHPFQRPEKPD